jgi:hypothetical protein
MPPKAYKCDLPRPMTLLQLLEEIKLTNEDLVVGNKVIYTNIVRDLFDINVKYNFKGITFPKNHYEICKINGLYYDFHRKISSGGGFRVESFSLSFDILLNQYSSADRLMEILNNNEIYFE